MQEKTTNSLSEMSMYLNLVSPFRIYIEGYTRVWRWLAVSLVLERDNQINLSNFTTTFTMVSVVLDILTAPVRSRTVNLSLISSNCCESGNLASLRWVINEVWLPLMRRSTVVSDMAPASWAVDRIRWLIGKGTALHLILFTCLRHVLVQISWSVSPLQSR